MKKFIALALVTLGITISARAQWIVYDPANTVQSVINMAQEIATRYHKPARSSLAEMLRELRAWTSKFPQQADAILPAWFYLFGAEAWSNCRSLLGVKFLVHAPDRSVFESFAREWTDCGDLFIYNPAASMRGERGIDVIP